LEKKARETRTTRCPKPPRKRRPGRPPAGQRLIGPGELHRVAKLWGEGHPVLAIAEELGVSEGTIRGHIARHVLPAWREDLQTAKREQLAKLGHIERVAWAKFHESEGPQTRDQIKRALSEKGVGLVEVERVATTISRTGEATWLSVVQWVHEQVCKIHGLYAASKVQMSSGDDEFRVAGATVEQVDKEMLARLARLIRERENRDSC